MKSRSDEKRAMSKYAQKQRRKYGNGTVDPRWMTWAENPGKPRRFALEPQR